MMLRGHQRSKFKVLHMPHGIHINMVLLGLSYSLLKQARQWRVKSFSPSRIVRGRDSVKDLLPYTIVNIK